MRATLAVHMEPGDTVETVEHNGSVWVEVCAAGDPDGIPIHGRTPEHFDALAHAAAEAARRMRGEQPQPFDLERELENAG